MTILQTIILGAVEGITEFLPISSTAHLMISAELLKVPQIPFVKSFEIAIQLGAVCAVLSLYSKKIINNPSLIAKIFAGFLPTAIIGFLLYPFIKSYLLGNLWAVFWSLFVGGIILIAVEMYELRKTRVQNLQNQESITNIEIEVEVEPSYKQAIGIGFAQVLAVIPGVSRSAATIISGRLFGLSKNTALEFSFLLALPTIAAAAGYDALKNISLFTENIQALTIGFVVSFVTAIIAIKFLFSFVKNHSFISFGIYRIVVATLILFFLV